MDSKPLARWNDLDAIKKLEDMADAALERKEARMSLAYSRDLIDMIVGLFESASGQSSHPLTS